MSQGIHLHLDYVLRQERASQREPCLEQNENPVFGAIGAKSKEAKQLHKDLVAMSTKTGYELVKSQTGKFRYWTLCFFMISVAFADLITIPDLESHANDYEWDFNEGMRTNTTAADSLEGNHSWRQHHTKIQWMLIACRTLYLGTRTNNSHG
jgi:hypothetical protein